MTQRVPLFKLNNNNFNKQAHIRELLEEFYSFRGQRLDLETVRRIFEQIRVLDTYKVSPFLYFGCFIAAHPQTPYAYEFQLSEMSTPDLISVPIPLLDMIQQTIESQGVVDRAFSIEFDPFEIEWRSQEEFDAFTNFMKDFNMDDVRYKYFLTVMWV